MKLRPPPIKGKIFRFMDLPAELRNAIYKFICSSALIKLTRRPQSIPRRKEARYAYSYLQLAHINRLMRQEFLPIYHHQITPHFHFKDTFVFTRTFLLPRGTESPGSSVTLDLSRAESIKQVNVYPLLKFIQSNTGVTLSIIPPRPDGITQNLQFLVQDLSTPSRSLGQKKWAQYFKRCVKELWIRPYQLHVRVIVNRAATEWWMGCDNKGVETAVWVRKTGFPMRTAKAGSSSLSFQNYGTLDGCC